MRNEGLIKISEVTHSKMGRPYTLVLGSDENGRIKIVWLDAIGKVFKPQVVYSVYLDQGITEEHALSIVEKEHLLREEEIKEIFIYYYRTDRYRPLLKNGLYWCVNPKGAGKHIYIDFFTGKYIVINTHGEVENSNY